MSDVPTNVARTARLTGKVAIVTGAGRGIGAAAAHAFVREGAAVVLVGRRRDVLERVSTEILAKGGTAAVVQGDVSLGVDAERIVAETMDRFGRLNHLFNNAGIQGDGGPIVDMAEAAFDELIAINLKGPWLMTKHGLRAMLAGDATGKAIVNTSSFLSTAATVRTSAYSATRPASTR